MEKAADPQIETQRIEVSEKKTSAGMSEENRKRLEEMYEKLGRK